MSETTWIQIRKKRRRFKVLIVGVICLIVAGVFIRNNQEILKQQHQAFKAEKPAKKTVALLAEPAAFEIAPEPETADSVPQETVAPDTVAAIPPAPQVSAPVVPKPAAVSVPATKPAPAKQDDFVGEAAVQNPAVQAPAPPVQQSVVIEKIRCTMHDRNDLRVVLGLEIFFTGDSAREEIMLKREDLKVMVAQVLIHKALDDMVVDKLRPEIKNAMNRIIKHKPITDLEFRDFRIEKVE